MGRTRELLGSLLLGLAGCTGEIGSAGRPLPVPAGQAAQTFGVTDVRRLSAVEYDNTVEALLRDTTRAGAVLLPEDLRTPFDNDVATQVASNALVTALESLATSAAARLLADPARRDQVIGCAPLAATDDACMRDFVRRFGRLALRRPLNDAEVADFVALGMLNASDAGDFYVGAGSVVRALLQDLELLYRVELGVAVDGQPGLFRLTPLEVATRLSFLIWGGPPDEALLSSAELGQLDDVEDVRRAAQAMLADPRARRQVERFHAMWLGYEQVPLPSNLVQAMSTETRALLDRVVFDERRPWLDLFRSTESFLDDTLALHYGLPAPGSATPVWVDVSSQGRAGILAHGTFLSTAANVADTSPTKRGKAIRERLLCQPIAPPPPGVAADKPPDSGGPCKIDHYAAHRAAGSCKSCHDQMDPLGFGLERFDKAGAYRLTEAANAQCAISGAGELLGSGTFNGPAELQSLLIASGRLDACAVQHLYQFTVGRALTADDASTVTAVQSASAAGAARFDELLLVLVSDPAFLHRKEARP
jgi:hypothetical protein